MYDPSNLKSFAVFDGNKAGYNLSNLLELLSGPEEL